VSDLDLIDSELRLLAWRFAGCAVRRVGGYRP
jgi:hypothetical protein